MMPSHTPAPVPRSVYLHPTVDVNWTSLPWPAMDIFDELDLVRSKLVKAKSRNDQNTTCLQAAHSQLAIVGCWAETCWNHAVATRTKQGKKSGHQIQNKGHGRIITDMSFIAEIQHADEEERLQMPQRRHIWRPRRTEELWL